MNNSASRIATDLHFDLSFLPDDAAPTLHVGRERIPLARHTGQTLQQYRAANAALGLIADEHITHYAEGVRLPVHYVQTLLVTTPPRLSGAKLQTLLLTKVHVPRASRQRAVRRAKEAYPARAAQPHPKLKAVGVNATMNDDEDVIVDVHDWVTAMDAAVSIIFHHVELVNIGGDTAGTVQSIIEYADGISDLALQILTQATAHQQDPDSQNWAFEAPYLDTDMKPTDTSYYNWSDVTKLWMKGPLGDSVKTAKNDTSLESDGSNAGVYTVQSGTTSVGVPQSSSHAPRAAAGDNDGSYWTVNNLTPHHGFEQSSEVSFENNTFSISFTNKWLRWLSGYAEFCGPDGKPVAPEGWTSLVPGGLARVYDSDTKKYVQIFSAVNTILAIPIGSNPTEISFTWPSNASSVRLMAGGIGRTGGVRGQDGHYVGSWDTQVCTAGAMMTGIFNFGIPVVCMVAGAAVSLSGLNDLAKDIFGTVLDVATAIVNGAVSGALSDGDTLTILSVFADLIPRLLLDIVQLAVWLDAEIAEGAAEKATPIFGWIALAVSVVSDLALLAETTAEVASSPATFELVASRAIDAQWTLLPDVNHQDTWPLEATHYEVTATFQDGTTRTTTGQMQSSPQTGPISVYFNQENANRLPAGGQVKFAARFYSDTGWLAGQAVTDYMSADIPGNLLTVPQMNITENLVPLTSTTVYQFDQKLVYGDGGHVWTNEGGAPVATVKNLSSSNVGNNLAQLVNISVSQQTSELGYTWEASGQGIPLVGQTQDFSGQMFTFQAIDDRSTPDDGLKFVPAGFTPQPFLVFDLNGPATGDGYNFWIDPRGGLYYVRQVLLDGTNAPFDLSTGTSWGRFNEQIDAAVVHSSGYLIGVNTANSKIEVLSLKGGAAADAVAPFAEMYSGYGTRPGLIHIPVGVAALPSAGFVVLEAADANLQGAGARIQAFDFLGNPAPVFAGGSATAALREEGEAVTLLDLAVESKGYIYVLKYVGDGSQVGDYRLDLYNPDGSWLAQTAGLSAAGMTVDLWRTLYTLNFEIIAKPDGGRTEPSVSIWLPSTPSGS